jgi:hypothetical protein
MRRFLNNLFRDLRPTGAARVGRRAPRRAAPQVEGLEDRLVLSTANPVGTTLQVVVSQGTASQPQQITFQADPLKNSFLDVLDNGSLLGRFSIASVKAVTVQVAGLDSVTVNDSFGLPFGTGVNMTLFGKGDLNTFNLAGTRPEAAGQIDVYSAGDGATDGSLVALNGNTFQFTNAIGAVSDSVPSTGGIIIDAFGAKATLIDSTDGTQKLSGLSLGGAGDSFSFKNQPIVSLGLKSDNASATLTATTAAAGEQIFGVVLSGQNDSVTIKATPSTVETDVFGGGVHGTNTSQVNLEANSGVVKIGGGSATTVIVGQPVSTGGLVTSGIKANVSVGGVKNLALVDSGNGKTQENVTVSESTITGLFGSSAVKLTYTDTGFVTFTTGSLAETYNLGPSKAGARFSSAITINDLFPKAALTVNVTVDSGSGLNLKVFHLLDLSGNGPTTLNVLALGATFTEPTPPSGPPFFEGTVDANFAGGLTSVFSYAGVENVNLINGILRR